MGSKKSLKPLQNKGKSPLKIDLLIETQEIIMSQSVISKQTKSQTKIIEHLPEGFLSTIQWLTNPVEFIATAQKCYGDIFSMKIPGFNRAVVISHPQAVEAVLSADPSQIGLSLESNRILQPLVGENSIILRDGLSHQRDRKLLMPPFHGARMATYGQLICNITKQVIHKLIPGKTINIRSYCQEITLRVILRIVFGFKEGERYEQLRQLLNSLFDFFNSPLGTSLLLFRSLQRDLGPMSPWGSFLRQIKQIDDLLIAEIRERQTQTLGEDILSLMMSARDEQGQPMTEAEFRDELMTLLFGANESTANTLAWALYWIDKLNEVRQKLFKELDTLVPEADPTAIAKLPYLNAVTYETLRLHPPTWFAFWRQVKSPFEVMGYRFEPGTIVGPCIYLTHHRPDIYPEPNRFKPERFLERQFSAYEFYPFGGGNRRCIGYAFAKFEIKLVLATILSQVQLTLVDNRPIRPIHRGITIAPAGGIRMMVTDWR